MFGLLRKISTISKGPNFVTNYYLRLKKLWDEYESLIPYISTVFSKEYIQYNQQLKMMQVLMGLNESHGALRSKILMMIPLPTHTQAYAMIQNEEKQRSVHATITSNEPSIAFYTQGQVSRNQNYSSRGGVISQPGQKNSNVKCNHCHLQNHTIDQCYKLIGYPANYSSRGGSRGRRVNNNRVGSNGSFNNGVNANNASFDQTPSFTDQESHSATQFMNTDYRVSQTLVFTQSPYQQIMQLIAGGNSSSQSAPAANHTTAVTGNVMNPFCVLASTTSN